MKDDSERKDGFTDSCDSDDSDDSQPSTEWKILVVDDEEDVHTVTRLALEDITVEGERPRILDAYSGEEGRRIFAENPDIAIVLLDVVMETQTSGLDMVKFIRRDLGNNRVRIILRTGHPGQAPERKVIEAYDINDYKTKTELTSDNLFTIIVAGMRSYKAYSTLENYGRGLEKKVARRTRELAKSEAKFKGLFDSINSGVAVFDAVGDGEDYVFVDFNRAGERIDDIRKEDLIGKSMLDVFPGVGEFGLSDVFRRVWRTGTPERFPMAWYKDDRILGWRENFVYKLPSGEIVAAYTDETIRKQSEEATRRATRALQMRGDLNAIILHAKRESDLFDGTCRIIVEIGQYKMAWVGLAGATRETMVDPAARVGFEGGRLASIRTDWNGVETIGDSANGEIGAGRPVIHRDIPNHPDGRKWRDEAAEHGYASSAAFPLIADNRFIGALNIYDSAPRGFAADEVDFLTGLANDLAHGVMSLRARGERKRAEAAWRESEDRFAKAFHSSPGLMAITTLENGVFLDVNNSFVRTIGYDREELLGVGSVELDLWVNPKDRVEFIKALRENRRVQDLEIRVRTKSGEIRSFLFSGEIIHIDNQPCLITVASDFTDRARMEKMMRESEERMRAQFKGVPVPTYIWRRVGEDFTLIDFNDAAMKITGGVIKNFMGVTAGELYYDEPGILDGMVRCFEKKNTLEHEIHHRLKSTPDSKHLAIKYAFAPPDLVLIHTEDLTEKKTLQAEAIRAGHLASLGELAAGIAHEINNPINGIISYAELLKDLADEKDEDDEIPVRIIKEGDRVAKIVRNLLSFARDRKEESSPALVRDVLSDSLGLMGSQIKKDGIKLTMDVPADLPKVRVRSQEIQQVFLNIISNSRYALNQKFKKPHEDKTIKIRVEAIEIDGRRHVRTTFRDAGVGIPDEILEKISNPFFSTKPPGEGTGLGLSISHGIIESHGGKLRFESVEGEYTKVVVDLPSGKWGGNSGMMKMEADSA